MYNLNCILHIWEWIDVKKKNIIITSVAVVIAFVIGMFVGDSMAINRVKKQFSSIGTSETTKKKHSEGGNY